MPVWTGWLIGRRRMTPGREFLDRVGDRALDRPLVVERLAQRVDDAAQQSLAHRYLQQLARAANFAAFLELRVVAEDDHANLGFVEVQRQARDAGSEVQHLVEHDVGEAFDAGDAIADFADDADVLLDRDGGGSGNLRLDFLHQIRHVSLPAFQSRASRRASRARTLPS